MSNGNLIRDLKKGRKAKEKNARCKNSASDETISNRTSVANPFVFEKKLDFWLTPDGQLYLESWANDGLTDEEIAKKMGIGKTTLYAWINRELEEKGQSGIRTAIIRGRDTSTMAVENMLYKCAMGFSYKEQQVTKDGDIVEVERYYEPSQEAQKFILTNRRKDKWKSKQEVALEAQVQAEAQVKLSQADQLADSLFGGDDNATGDSGNK